MYVIYVCIIYVSKVTVTPRVVVEAAEVKRDHHHETDVEEAGGHY